MDFRADAVQSGLGRAVRAVLSPPRPESVWEELARLGVHGLGLPQAAGGLDLGVSAEVVVGVELGRALEPLAGYRESVHAAALLSGCEEGRELAAGVAAGTHRLAVTELAAGPDGRVHGRSGPLPAVPLDAVVAAGGGGAPALVRLPAPGCSVDAVRTLAGEAVRVTCDGCAGSPLTELASEDQGRALAGARLRQAALLTGVAEAALVLARDHTGDRQQFGRPLRELQTVSHRLAGVAAEAEGLRLLLHEAAWGYDTGRAWEPAASAALASAAELALRSTRVAVQLHGARGLLSEARAGWAYRLAAAEAARWGPPVALWRETGRRVLDGAV